MEKMNDLKDLLRHEIQDLYSAEEQIIEALPKMIDKADNKILKSSLSEHLRITETQKTRLDQVQKLMGDGPDENKKGFLSGLFGGGSKHECKGMKGIIDEGNKIISADMDPEVLDAAIIACTQKVEHYEICGYGTARSYAEELGLTKVEQLLKQTLEEEYDADLRLTELAQNRVNKEAERPGRNSGDRSASGSASGRSGKETARERVGKEEMEMEPVSNRRNASAERKNSASERSNGPKATGSSPRSGDTGRGATSSKRTTANGSSSKAAAKKSSGSNSGRSSSGDRGSSRSGR